MGAPAGNGGILGRKVIDGGGDGLRPSSKFHARDEGETLWIRGVGANGQWVERWEAEAEISLEDT